MSGRRSGGIRSENSAKASGSNATQARGSRAPKAVSYAEDSDSSDSDIPLVKAASSTKKTNPPPSRSQANRRQRPATSDASPRPRKRRETSTMAIGRPRPANTVTRERIQNRHQGKLPAWPEPAKLPYEVLLNIFQYAAYPLVDATQKATPGAAWLVKIALLRRDFVEPAMAALYYSPPLEPATRAHSLLKALNAQTESSLANYRRKIHHLEIPTREVLVYKCQGQDPLTLAQMIAVMPNLRGIRLNWPNDDPAVRSQSTPTQASKVQSWYGEHIWDLLDENNIKLSHWKWNNVMTPLPRYPWMHMKEIHQRACFKDLKSLELCCLRPSLPYFPVLNSALDELEQLAHVTISNPVFLNDITTAELFEHIRPLSSLSILHCNNLTSRCIVNVLRNNKCASSMQHLTLSHNQSMNLAFLSELQTLTPHLRTLTMDLTFYSRLDSVRSADPQFEHLLPAGHTPQWPHSLERLQLVHLRKWDTQAAYTFLNSLVEAAPQLRHLRYLGLRMSVDADWRDRVKFRNVWEQRMVRVFQRRCASPRRWTSGGSGAGAGAGAGVAPKKSARQASQRNESADEQEDKEEGDENGAGGEQNPRRIPTSRGMCDRVDVRIENLRPMDQLLDESNFLDEEKSGDEDYRD